MPSIFDALRAVERCDDTAGRHLSIRATKGFIHPSIPSREFRPLVNEQEYLSCRFASWGETSS
jgi:hypothetical protein